jgi:hypothetical protein
MTRFLFTRHRQWLPAALTGMLIVLVLVIGYLLARLHWAKVAWQAAVHICSGVML